MISRMYVYRQVQVCFWLVSVFLIVSGDHSSPLTTTTVETLSQEVVEPESCSSPSEAKIVLQQDYIETDVTKEASPKEPSWCNEPTCHARLQELQSKLELEKSIEDDFIRLALLRSKEDPYYRRDPDILKKVKEYVELEVKEELEKYDNPQWWPKPEWKRLGSFPELSVVGHMKAGSSQLYKIFATHKGVVRDDWKEHCSDEYEEDSLTPDTWEYQLFKWHEHFFHKRHFGKLRVNGCLNIQDYEYRWHYNPPPSQTNAKFFMLFRDPADWMWAHHHFFFNPYFEDEPDYNIWVNETLHYRSPELFHELVLSGNRLLPADEVFYLRGESILNARRMKALVGEENMVFLKNEDLRPDRIVSSGLLEKLSQVTGLSLDGFDPKTIKSITNCNAQKGVDHACEEPLLSVPRNSGYAITRNRPMLAATRRLIYIMWHEECKVWAEEFGIVYQACLDAVEEQD